MNHDLRAGITMTSALALFLKSEIERRGWNDSDLADRAGMQRSTLSKILKNPEQIPKLETLLALSTALEVELSRLVILCGFPLGKEPITSKGEQIAMLLEGVPELQGFLDVLAGLRPEDIRAVRAYAEGMKRSRGGI